MQVTYSARLGLSVPTFSTNVADLHIGWVNGVARLYAAALPGPGAGYSAYTLSTAGGAASLVSIQAYPAYLTHGSTPQIAVSDSADGACLLAAGLSPAGLASYALTPSGTFGGALSLNQSFDPLAVTTATFGGATYVYFAAPDTAEPYAYRLLAGGSLVPLRPAQQPAGHAISALAHTSTAAEGRYLLAASAAGNAITSHAIASDGSLTAAGQLTADHGTGFSKPTDVGTLTVLGTTYVIVAGSQSSSLSTFRLLPGGAFLEADHVVDNLNTRFASATALATVQVGERGFAFVGGADGGIDVLTLLADGRLVHLLTIADTASLSLADLTALAAARVGSHITLFAASETEPGISQIDLDIGPAGLVLYQQPGTMSGGAGNDLLHAGTATTAVHGGSGDDIIVSGGAGSTATLFGGAGHDLFVISAGAQIVTVADYETGIDRLDLTSLPLLRNLGQLTITPTAAGADIVYGPATIRVLSHDGNPIASTAFAQSQILRLDRFARNVTTTTVIGTVANDTLSAPDTDTTLVGLDGDDSLIGGAGNDRLEGGRGADSMSGGGGGDWLAGEIGNDTLRGQDGNDVALAGEGQDLLDGGAGDDTLAGDGGNDTLLGGDGGDLASGGDGDDSILGDAGADTAFGGNGNDRLFGGDGNDSLHGDAGSDIVQGEAGDDVLSGGAGHDSLYAGNGADSADGGDDNDLLVGGDGDDTLSGGAGVDLLDGGEGDDQLFGGDGADRLDGRNGRDRMFGGAGNDILFGQDGDDSLHGDAGDDTLHGELGRGLLDGGAGNDSLLGGEQEDTARGGTGNDWIAAYGGDDSLAGDDGNDTIGAAAGNDTILGGNGNDIVWGGNGNDDAFGEAGNDTIYAGNGSDRVFGGAGNDWIEAVAGQKLLDGGADHDRIFGGGSADTIQAGDGQDFAKGGDGADLIFGGNGHDNLGGGLGDDVVQGDGGNDSLWGWTGNDQLYGGAGNDILRGGGGADRLFGGAGADIFIFESAADVGLWSTNDTIWDFTRGVDKISLWGLGLRFAGTGGTGAARELRTVAHGNGVVAYADITGDGQPDLSFYVDGVTALTATDFFL